MTSRLTSATRHEREPLALAGRYRIEAEIGRGGMSVVYRAMDTTLDRPVAVKIMHAEFLREENSHQRFRHEARAAAQLSHPHVVTVIDAGEEDGQPYIVFEYVGGETLKQRIKRGELIPITEAIAYAIEIGRALSAAHACGIVHRDVKPQNVLIDSEGHAKVTDFGIARSVESDGLTLPGRVLGTTDYVSPEQALGETVTERSDVYSLGIVLFEMLTGHPPFRGENHVNVAVKHIRTPIPDVQKLRAGVSAALASVVERATKKPPEARYPTIDAMVEDLEQVLSYEIARAGQATREATQVMQAIPRDVAVLPTVRPRRGRRKTWLALVAVAVAATVAAALAFTDVIDDSRSPDAQLKRIQLPSKPALDYDPHPGDGREHASKLQLVVDGNPQTFWDTESYHDRSLGTKSGVGLLIDAGRPVAARQIRIQSPPDITGYSFEVLGSDGPPPATRDGAWTLLGRGSAKGAVERVPLDAGDRRFHYYLVWFTELGGRGPFQAGIAEISLYE